MERNKLLNSLLIIFEAYYNHLDFSNCMARASASCTERLADTSSIFLILRGFILSWGMPLLSTSFLFVGLKKGYYNFSNKDFNYTS